MSDTDKRQCDLLIRNCRMLTPGFEILEHASVAVVGSQIGETDLSCQVDDHWEAKRSSGGRRQPADAWFY